MNKYETTDKKAANHQGYAFPTWILKGIETYLPDNIECSAETGCGKSTILFSNYSQKHIVFAIDDRDSGKDSSVLFYEKHRLTNMKRVQNVLGPSQATLPKFAFKKPLDLVLIDGGHGFPFPELEYYFFYPHMREGSLLILDDVQIPTIGRMGDILAEDDMWEFVALVSTTALFRRTKAPTFDPFGDGWWLQRYNRRRVSPNQSFYLNDGQPIVETFSSQNLDVMVHGDGIKAGLTAAKPIKGSYLDLLRGRK